MDLCERSDDDLLADTTKLVGSHREITARLVAHLAEIEERRLHLVKGFSSMFDFCTKALRLGEGEAFRRILAARLYRQFPVVYSLIASGSVTLSTLELLREWLTNENHEELLTEVVGKSKREVQTFLAARFPQPDTPSRIRRQSNIAPLSEGRFKVEFTATGVLREKLELCRDLMSHANPSRDLGVVVERALDLLLQDLEKKRLRKTKRPPRADQGRVTPTPSLIEPATEAAESSQIRSAVRREVFERDGTRCTYVSEDGRRCNARAFLEIDHIRPKALGGPNHSENLRVRCRAHNQLWAEQAFGRERVESRRHFRQQKSTLPSDVDHETRNPACLEENPPKEWQSQPPILEKVRLALRGLGFRESQVRRALGEVARKHDSRESLDLEQALREALLVATAA